MIDPMPYLDLDYRKKVVRKEVVVTVRVRKTKKVFPATRTGAKNVAKLLVECQAESFLHSSSLDRYDEYGLKFDILDAINQAWKKLKPSEPLAWWVIQINTNLNNTLIRSEPFKSEAAARKEANCHLGKIGLYLVTLLDNGELTHTPLTI